MRVLLVNKYWYPRGGAEAVVRMTQEGLTHAGHEVHAFGLFLKDNWTASGTFLPFTEYDSAGFLSQVKQGIASIYNTKAKRAFEKTIKEFRPDVIHFHNIYHQLSFSLIDAAADAGVPSVMTLHDYKIISPNYLLFHHGKIQEESLGGNYYRCLLSNCMERLDRSFGATLEAYVRQSKGLNTKIVQFISPSKFLKEKCVEAGIKEENITVVPNPMDLPELSWGVQDKDQQAPIVYVGRLSKEKGVDVLLAAMAQLPSISLIIVGDGKERSRLEALAKTLGLSSVSFLGKQSPQQVQEVLSSAAMVVAPSLWYENAPLSILEAIACSVLVVASDIGGIPEILPKEFLVRPGDATALAKTIKKWYDTPLSVRESTMKSLRDAVRKKHSLNTYIDRITKLYHSVCTGYPL